MTVQQKTPCEDNRTAKRENGTGPNPERDNDINARFGESEKTFKRGHDGHPPPTGEHGRTPYGYGDITLNINKD